MLTSELTVHMLKCIVREHVCCPLIHDSSFIHSYTIHDEISFLFLQNLDMVLRIAFQEGLPTFHKVSDLE